MGHVFILNFGQARMGQAWSAVFHACFLLYVIEKNKDVQFMVNMSARENLVTDMVTDSLLIMLPRLLFWLFIRRA